MVLMIIILLSNSLHGVSALLWNCLCWHSLWCELSWV